MNFFEHQAKARTQSKRLVALFLLAVAAIVAAITTVVAISLDFAAEDPSVLVGDSIYSRHPVGATFAAILTVAIIGLSSLYKIAKLRAGGGAVARQLGGTLVSSDASDPRYRRLRNVVEEIAIASGVPVPEIYVLEDEVGINAFAAGYAPADAAVTVTRGALEQLDRDELQGVIAHEFSHVLNGDMRLNIKLMGVLFGILVISVVSREVVAHSRGSGKSKDGGWIVLVALAVMIIGYIGLFFGRLIKAGVSRQREFLADASAVQFTRQNLGIAGALRKIGSLEQGSKIENPDVEEVSHMLFGDGVGYSRLFATHPALEERLQRIDPTGMTRDRVAKPTAAAAAAAEPDEEANEDAADETDEVAAAGFAAGAAKRGSRRGARAASRDVASVAPASVVSQVGNPATDDYRAASQLSDGMPERLRVAAYMQDQAPAVVLALALDREPGLRETQFATIATALGDGVRKQVEALTPDLAALGELQRLPLAAIAFPALRRKPRPYLEQFVAALNGVIHADGEVHLREYCLARLVTIQVVDSLDPSKSRVIGRRKVGEVTIELAATLAILAAHGTVDADRARQAYVAGMQGLAQHLPPYAPPKDAIRALDTALPALDKLDPAGKQLVVEALVRVMAHDGTVAVAEAELLRTICAALHCPLPPMLGTAA